MNIKLTDTIIVLAAVVFGGLALNKYFITTPSGQIVSKTSTTSSQIEKPRDSPVPEDQQKSKKTDEEILVEIENRLNEYREKLKGHYPSDNMLKALSEDSLKLFILETGYAKPDNESQKKTLSKVKALRTKVDALRRNVYAKTLERVMLDKGINAEVQVKGANSYELEYKYAVMSKAMAYKLTNEGGVLESAKNAGFTKLTFTDGFNSSWSYELTKKK